MTDTESLGNRLVQARTDAGMDQDEVATLVGVDLDTLSRWESDARSPRSNRITTMAGILGVTFRWLLTGEGPKHRPALEPIGREEAAESLAAIRSQLDAVLLQVDSLTKRLKA